MTERSSDRWISIGMSVLLHGTLVGLLVFGWWTYHQKTKVVTPSLAIEATVVDSRSVKGAAAPTPAPQPPPPPTPAPQPEPQPPPPVEQNGPPEPTPDELAQRAKAQQEQEDAAKRKQDEQAAAVEAQHQADQKRAEDQKRQAQQKADAERKAKEEAEAKKRAEEQKVAAQKKLEDDKRKALEAQQRAQSEADLKRSLEAEDRANAARSSGALASWEAQITARIERAWLKPPSARSGIVCELDVTQIPGGAVTNARVGECNGDQAVRESIVAAAYRASPLPPPPDPSLFERELQITFRPAD
jgi:colicin import membrane protein